MTLDLASLRGEFPLLQTKTYLNSCSSGVMSRAVERAFHEYLRTRHQEGSAWEAWVAELEKLRGLLGQLLACQPADVSISSSLSQSLNALASSLDFDSGRDTVVVTDFDFPTASQIWLSHRHRGARVVRAEADDSGVNIPLERFDALIDDRTLLVSVPWVCYRNGVKLDIAPIIDMAHERGALVFVDGYQGIGTFPVAAPATGADFMAGGCLKYLLGTAGIAFMYVRDSEDRGQVPVATGWFAQEDVGAMDIYHNRPARTARRFESGTPNVSAAYACAAGIEVLLGVGLEAVQRQIGHLTDRIAERARAHGFELVTPAAPQRHGALMALASADAPALVRRLAADGIVVSDRGGNLRVSPHFYNDDGDVDMLFRALERHADLLQPAA